MHAYSNARILNPDPRLILINSTIRNRLLLQVIHFRNPAPIPAPMLHVHITLQSREFSIQNPILHTEDRELFEYYNSTHRRQGDLLEMHPCVLQTFKATPVAPETFRTFQSFMTFQPSRQFYNVPVSPGNPPHSSIFQLECIFYSSIGFHRKLHRVPVGQLQTLQTLHSKKGRCCDIG